MDCCNYMPHRQAYYGSQYYESGPTYHADFQQPQYGMHQYTTPPNWAFAASCSDYVYNPKEARIRKAMRERERSMGAAQMGNVRSRRPNWPKPPVHMPGPGPSNHPDHLLNAPSKELCSALRAEMEHGFLAGNGGYMYQSQQYPFSPQSDYAAYIQVSPGLSNWVQNQYNMQQQGNVLAHQQIWNQYQSDRLRAQQNAGPSYLLNPQGQPPDYQHVEHNMPPNNMMQMGPTSKSATIHQNLENAAHDVERYMNISSTMSSNTTTTNIEPRTPISESLQTIDNAPPRTVATSTPNASTAEVAEGTNGSMADVNDMVTVSGMQENTTPPELNISSVTALSEVDAQINNMETAGSGSETNFPGITLFDDSNISGIASHLPVVHNERKNSNSLPDFNQAFGSTERGRFQSPPDPRLGPDKVEYLGFMTSNFPKAEQYNKWVDAANSYTASNYY